jgi:hypothetical protein
MITDVSLRLLYLIRDVAPVAGRARHRSTMNSPFPSGRAGDDRQGSVVVDPQPNLGADQRDRDRVAR